VQVIVAVVDELWSKRDEVNYLSLKFQSQRHQVHTNAPLHVHRPDNRWEGQMGFSEVLPFLSGRKFSNFQIFIQKKFGYVQNQKNCLEFPSGLIF
jgi:hypothetical protein